MGHITPRVKFYVPDVGETGWGNDTAPGVSAGFDTADTLVEILSDKNQPLGYAGLDQNGLLVASEFPAFSGDIITAVGGITGSQLVQIGSSGTYNQVTVDNKGRVVSGVTVSNSIGPFSGDYLFVPFTPISRTTGGTMYGGTTLNMVWGYKFVLDRKFTINQISSLIVTAGASGALGGIAIYNLQGNKLADTGPVSVSASASGYINVVLPQPITLTPGLYYVCFTCNNLTAALLLYAIVADNLFTTYSNIIIQGSNPSVAGQMPQSLGTISLFASSPLIALLS